MKAIKNYKNNENINLEKVIDEYSGYVYKIIRNMVKENLPEEDIEEIATDTFLIVWKNNEKLDEEKLMSSYIAGIVRNLVKEKLRKANINSDISDYENVLQDSKKIDMICEEREKISIIENTLSKMKEEDIHIFNLFYYSNMKIHEIAEEMNLAELNIKSRLFRIRKKIKKELIKGGYSNEE